MNKTKIVIFGELDDPHVEVLASKTDALVISNDDISDIDISINGTSKSLYLAGNKIEASSVFWRNLDIYPFADIDSELRNELTHMSLMIDCLGPAKWVNPVQTYVDHFFKYNQLEVIKRHALIPDSYITTSFELAKEFIDNKPRECIVKPVVGGDYTVKIKASDLDANFPEPYLFQEFIEGQSIRTIVVGDNVYAFQIQSDLVDFRIDEDAIYIDHMLPDKIRKQCLDITKALGYYWTAIDWQLRDSNYYCLEANFSPCFLYPEMTLGYPVSDELVKLLIS